MNSSETLENKTPIELEIKGMNCASCAIRLEKVLNEISGVLKAHVSFSTERALIYTKPHMKIQPIFQAIKKAGFKVRQEKTKNLKEKWVIFFSVLLSAPFLLHMIPSFSNNTQTIGFHLSPLMEMLLATPIQFLIGLRFYRGAFYSLKGKSANMDVLVVMGTSTAYFYSLFLMLSLGEKAQGQLFFEASAIIITLVLVGKHMESKAKQRAAQAIHKLLSLRPKTALLRLPDGKTKECFIDDIHIGDIVVCRTGDKVPVDGLVVHGEAQVDESFITGESLPIFKTLNHKVIAGSLNIDGLIDIKTQATGIHSTLHKMIQLVENAQATKPPIERLVDKVCGVFVPAVILFALITFLGWFIFGPNLSTALLNAISVLVIACPCALGLATPTAIITGSGAAAQSGVLIKDISALEQAHSLSHVVFDKTGTLTYGKPTINEIELFAHLSEDKVLQIATSLQQGSQHPIAFSLRKAAEKKNLNLFEVKNFKNIVGKGVTGDLDGVHYLLGNAQLFKDKGMNPSPRGENSYGTTQVWLGVMLPACHNLLARFEVSDTLRPESQAAIEQLDKLNIKSLLVSGDDFSVAQNMGRRIGIKEIYGEARPEDKDNIIKKLMESGATVAMVGDGINDAPALARASVGIAMGSGTDLALETASVTLTRSDPRLVPGAIDISRKTFRKIKQNLFWAFIYNIIGIPLAALGHLTPALAGLAMTFSSLTVISNSLTLRSWKPHLKENP